MEGWDSCKTGRRSARCTDRRSYCKAHRAASKVFSSSVVLTGNFTHFSDRASAHDVMQYHILNSIQQSIFVYICRREAETITECPCIHCARKEQTSPAQSPILLDAAVRAAHGAGSPSATWFWEPSSSTTVPRVFVSMDPRQLISHFVISRQRGTLRPWGHIQGRSYSQYAI